MIIWGAMVVPFIFVIVLLIFFEHKTKWWEVAIPLITSFLLIISLGFISEYFNTKSVEVWNGWVLSSHYYEFWNQYIHKTCSNSICSGTGTTRTCTHIYYNCSYVKDHPAYWTIIDSDKNTHRITKKTYNYIVSLFNVVPSFVDMKRPYHTKDGDMYQVLWPGTDKTIEPINVGYPYENRVKDSQSVFNYEKISDKKAKILGLFSYPEIDLFNYPSVLGDCGPQTAAANKKLRFYNSILGSKKELRIWLLCTDSSDPQFGQLQESYWVGGNKNEVVVIIGEGWVHVFSWTDNKTPIIEIKDFLSLHRKENLLNSINFIAETLSQQFQRKHFSDFSYLTVEPPFWTIVLVYILTLLVNCGVSFFVIHNEWQE